MTVVNITAQIGIDDKTGELVCDENNKCKLNLDEILTIPLEDTLNIFYDEYKKSPKKKDNGELSH